MSQLYKALLCLHVSKCFVTLFLFFFICQHGSAQLIPGIRANGRPMNQGDTVTICIGSSISYVSTAQGPAGYSVQWRFDGGTPPVSPLSSVSVSYNTAGFFTTWQVIISGTNRDSTYIFVKVNDIKPTALFTFSPDSACGNVITNFTNQSSGSGLSYLWTFESGITSTLQYPTYQFLSAVGASGYTPYLVKLLVTNDQVCKDSITKTVTVKKVPDASIDRGATDFQYAVFNGVPTFRKCASLPSFQFHFINISTTPAIISGYTIKWGDGSPDSSFTSWPVNTSIIAHTFLRGQSSMQIIATGTNGCVGIKNYNVFLGTNPGAGLQKPPNTSVCNVIPLNQLTFNITGADTNTIGTIYKIIVNDGSPSVTYQQPPPASYVHNFTTTSCGTTSSDGINTYPNAFSVNLTVSNPCAISSATVTPIYVSSKPKAQFVAPQNVCVNSATYIYSSSSFGTVSDGGTCTNNGKLAWTISPSTYSTTYSLGTYNSNYPQWIAGSSGLYVNFLQPGTYTIKLYVGNDANCGIDSITKTICVRLPPTANFTANKHTLCAPDTVAFTNTSPIGTCLGETYNWQVTYQDPLNCNAGSGYSFVPGSSATTRDVRIRFTNAGRYIITLTETAEATGCTSATFRDTIDVKAKPRIVLNRIPKVCLGNPVSPAATVYNCYSSQTPIYHWDFPGGTPATSDSLTPGPVVYTNTGINTVTFSAENECGITTVSTPDTIIAVPLAKAGPDTSTCSGIAVRIGDSTGTYTYAWSPATGLSNSNIARPVLTFTYNGLNADTTLMYIQTASVGNNCSNRDTVLVTVKTKPVVTISPASTSTCNGSPVMLVATGATTYSWSPVATLSNSNTDTVFASPTSFTTYTVTGTLNGCTNTGTAAVTPRIVIARDSIMCNSSTAVQMTATPTGGTWSGHPAITPGGVFNPNAAGIGVHNVIYTHLGCSDTAQATVTNGESAYAPTDTTICQAPGTIQLTGFPSGGTWSGSPLVTAGGIFSTNTPGTYSLIYRIGGGSCIARDTVIITVNGGITNNNLISADQSICTGGQPVQINGQAASGGGNGAFMQYIWEQSPDGINWMAVVPSATGQNYTPPAGLTQTTYYRRKASTSLCSGPQTSISLPVKVTINPDAKALFTTSKTVGCVTFRIDTAIHLTPFPAADSAYRWYIFNAGGVLVMTGSGLTCPPYPMSIPGDSATVKLVAISRFGCKNDSMQVGFKTITRPAPAFTQSDSVGCGPIKVLFANNTPNAAQYTYQWLFYTGQTSTQQQPDSISFPTNPLSGDTVYTVRFITISQCSQDTLLRYVRVKAKPKALFTPDRTNGCSSYNYTFTNTSRGNGNTYVWDFGDGSPIRATNADTVRHIYHTGVIDTFRVKLVATNECGTDSLIYKLVVQPITIRPDFAINGNERFGCGPSHTVHFINNSQGGSNFTWDFGDGSPLLPRYQNVDTVPHTYTTTGTFTIRLRATNSCSDTTDIETVTVYPKPTVVFTAAPLTACFGDTIHFFNNSDTGLVNNWRFGDGSSPSPLRNPTHVYAAGGNYTVRLIGTRAYPNGTNCADSAFVNLVIKDTLPGLFTASDTAVGCTPAIITFKNVNRPAATTSWSFGDNTTANGDSVTHSYSLPGIYIVKMTSRGLAGCTYTYSKTITVTSPAGSIQYNNGYLCPGIPLRMQATVNNTTQQIRYFFGNGDSLTTTNPVVFYTYQQPGVYVPYAYAMAGSCQALLARGDTVRVDRLRVGFRTQQQQQCGFTTVTFTDTSYAYFGIQSYQYSFGDNTSSPQQNPVKTYTASGTYNVRLRIVGVSGCVDTITIPVVVSVRRFPVSTISGDSLACIGQPVALTALVQSTDAVASYSWDFGNGVTDTGVTTAATYNQPGTYTVRLISRTAFGCADTVYKTVRVSPAPIVNAGPDVRICRGQSIQLGAVGANTWQWSPLQNLSCTTCPNPVANPLFTTSYVVTGSSGTLCRAGDTIVVEVVQPFNLTVTPTTPLCIGDSVQLFANGAYTYAWSPATGLDNPVLNNPIANPKSTTVYQVVGKDRYNCFTDTDYVRINVGPYPTVALGPDQTITIGQTIVLNPVTTNGPITRWTWTPASGLSCANCPNPTVGIGNNTTYRLEVETQYGCKARDTVTIMTLCSQGQMYVPNAFSPDGDGTNDVFYIQGRGITIIKNVRVFNRWGQVVYERSNINPNDVQQGWNGNINGIPAAIDVYVVTAEVVCVKGDIFHYKGNVSLLR